MTCTITREGSEIFSGETSTSLLHRKIDTLIEFLLRANPVPSGSVLLTGTGIIVKEDSALAAGDVVSVRAEPIGELSNGVVVV
jgi:2-dehydro-3-deoxy-D-arabinonate dehydratase